MTTHCISGKIAFQPHFRRRVEAGFDGGTLSTDGGAVLLRDLEERLGIVKRFTCCFDDRRDQAMIEHSLEALVRQRVFALALGHEDVNDHDQLRHDRLLALACGRKDLDGATRRRARDRGIPLAGKSTLDRIVLDVDATDMPLHGRQEGRFFHGCHDEYCHLPLYIFCGERLLCAKLRTSNRDASDGLVEELERIVPQLRAAWPETRIVVRGDSGFCRERIMTWCEGNGVHHLFGLARNKRLLAEIAPQMERSRRRSIAMRMKARQRAEAGDGAEARTAGASRRFRDFQYRTLKSWSRPRWVVGKAEYTRLGPNPRFVVTSLPRGEADARELYEGLYCAGGEMENRIKEQKLMMFADRVSTRKMHSNQIRLHLSSIAYVLMQSLRRLALAGTALARAQCGTIRVRLLKLATRVSTSVRRVRLQFSDSHPGQGLFRQVAGNIARIPKRA